MGEYVHPTDFESRGCGARSPPFREPLNYYNHGGCPASYRDSRQERVAQADGTEELNKKLRESKLTNADVSAIDDTYDDDRLEDLKAEVITLRRHNVQITDPATLAGEIAALEVEFGLRPGARDAYPCGSSGASGEWTEPDVPALVSQYCGKRLTLHSFVYALSGVEWGVCTWGSCQYATALAMFRALARLRRAGLDPTEVVGWGKTADLTKDAIPIAEALAKIAAGLTAEIRECSTLDRAFGLMRERSWDLWTAASHTAQLVFKTDFAHIEGNVDASPGIGKSLNILAQSDNYTTALRCFLLQEVGYVADPDTAFADFYA